jgi:NAD+ kinase
MSTTTHDFRNVALVGRTDDARAADVMLVLASHLVTRGCKVLVTTAEAASFPGGTAEAVPEPEIASRSDLVIAVGGDGTMLRAARLAAVAEVPLLGVNRGRLGFLADIGPEQMLDRVDDALAGRCQPESRMLLQASLRQGDVDHVAIALNDVLVAKRDSGRMLDVRTWVDGAYVNTHGGDGFIVSTSTGSTAYALSCGGPIIHPSMAALVLVPICPHKLSDRPVVVGADCIVEIEVSQSVETRAQVVCDGEVLCDLEPGVRLRVSRAPVSVTLLHPPGHDYYRILRSKLHWGRGPREGHLQE